MPRQYWLLLHRSLTDRELTGFAKSIHGSILEINLDLETFLWPLKPHTQQPGTHELCEVCNRYKMANTSVVSRLFRDHCLLLGEKTAFPCAFDPITGYEEHENIDNLLIDGSPLDYSAGYSSPSTFLWAHNITPESFFAISLGVHNSIRACRNWLEFNSLNSFD